MQPRGGFQLFVLGKLRQAGGPLPIGSLITLRIPNIRTTAQRYVVDRGWLISYREVHRRSLAAPFLVS